MKTVGMLLKEARMAKGYSLEFVEAQTKIRAKFLAALETNDFHRLPTPTIVRGFVHNYAEFLGLESQTVLAFLRRQMGDVSKSTLLPKRTNAYVRQSLFQLTPTRFLLILVSCLIGIFFLYLGLQYRQITQPPLLSIDSPKEGMVSTEKKIELIGKTDPDATIVMNNVSVLVRSDGRFYDVFVLEPGVNRITIVATSRFAKTTTITREVGYKP